MKFAQKSKASAPFEKFLSACLLSVALGACSQNVASPSTQQGAAVGAAVGAGSGAMIGSSSGDAGAGALIGAGAGALVGGAVGGDTKDVEEKLAQQDEIIRRQRIKLEQQQKEIQDLRRQEYYNNLLREYE
jgi:hypothetical protein